MELRQLSYFVAVAEEGSFTRGAGRLYVAQPGVSQQIRRLERELGVALLDRSGHTVGLTEAGAIFLAYARAALGAVESGRAALSELRGLVRGQLAIGMIQALGHLKLAGLLARYHRRYPGVEVSLREDRSEPLVEALREGRLHVAVIGLPGPEPPPGIHADVLNQEPLVLVVSVDHRLAGSEDVTLDVLRDEPLFTLTRGSGLRRLIETACAQSGFEPRVAFETSDLALLTELASHGLGVTIVPASVAAGADAPGTLRVLPIRPQLTRYTALAWRAGGPPTPAAQAFLALAGEHLRRD